MANAISSTPSSNKKTRIERILEPFGARHASGLIEFFDKVAEADFDVVVFMARKSLCIYRMMQLCGVKRINVPVFSDARLEGDLEWFEGKRVLVVDDTLFVGTTLSNAKNILGGCRTRRLEFWVYCADGETWSDEYFHPDYIHTILTAQETLAFCSAECRAMINASVPYLLDFAASRRIVLTPTQLDRAIKPINWVFHDVSSQYHERSKVRYYSGFCDEFTKNSVRSITGGAIFDLIDIAKIRVFATWTGRAYEVTFVPVITFLPTDRSSLRRAVRYLCLGLRINYRVFTPSNVRAKMRFLQYVIGALFLRTYWESLDQVVGLRPDAKYCFEWSSSVFSERQAEAISRVIARIYSNNVQGVKKEPPVLVRREPSKIRKETNDDIDNFIIDYFSGEQDLDFVHTPLSDLTAIFLEFQSRFESAARLEVKNKVEYPRYRDRLNRGMAWSALCSYILGKYGRDNNGDGRNILSLVLDRLIDFGIAVPIIALSGESVYRAYRHGEDVRFGAQEESLVFNMLQGFQNARASEGIEATYIEKLVVILLRVGMNEEWLNLWYSNSGRDNLVRVGYHLQGAVPICPRRDDELVPEGQSSWLSRRLLKTGTLTRTAGPGHSTPLYHLGKAPDAAYVRNDAARTAKGLGNALGKACISGARRRTGVRPLGVEDMIILTSCSNPFDTTGAMAAELRIFCDWYENEGAQILRAGFSKPATSPMKVVLKGSRGAQAINSAAWKYRKFKGDAIKDIKAKIAALSSHDPDWDIREGYWEAVFNAFKRLPEESEGRRLDKIRDTLYALVVCFTFLLECLQKMRALADAGGDSGLSEFANFLRTRTLPAVVPRPDLRAVSRKLTRPYESDLQVRGVLSEVGGLLDAYGRSLCALAGEEAAAAESVILKASRRLSRIRYDYMIWYDILDVRARRQGSPDATEEYGRALDKFRDDVNSMLGDAQERIRTTRGDLFSDTGHIGSFNDEKHLFFNLPGGSIEEGNRVLCDIVRLAENSGVKLRLLAVPTNLRGDHVFLNRGSTSIDGDFKSHVHTIIESVKHHKAEGDLDKGECIVWMLRDSAKEFKPYGSLRFERGPPDCELKIRVDIRGFVTEDAVVYMRSINR